MKGEGRFAPLENEVNIQPMQIPKQETPLLTKISSQTCLKQCYSDKGIESLLEEMRIKI